MSFRRSSYASCMRRTSGSPSLSAASAAYCAAVGTHITVYWWIFIICSMISAGAHDTRDVRDVRGVGEVDLVAIVEGRAERKVDRLGHADGHEDLALRVVADAA